MLKSGQVAMEYILTVGIVLIIVIPTAVIFYRQASYSADEINFAQIDKFGRDVVANAEKVYYLGHPSRIVLQERLPDKVENISVVQDPDSGMYLLSIAVRADDGIMDFTYPTSVRIAGYFGEEDISAGLKNVNLQAGFVANNPFVAIGLGNSSCVDGTIDHDACFTPPFYCFNGVLLDDCTVCGCPVIISELQCKSNGLCLVPVITGVAPASGKTSGGDIVVISGSDFIDTPVVEFGGVAGSVTFVSSTELSVVTPAGSGTVNVVVTNPDGGTGTLAAGFTYLANKLFIKDSVGNNAASIADDGNLVLKGTIEENSVHLATASTEWIVRIGGEDVFILDTADGNLYIDGNLFQNQATLTPPVASNNFIVKDIIGNVVMYVDATGDLYLKGSLTESGSP